LVMSFFRNWSASELINFSVFFENDMKDLCLFFRVFSSEKPF